MSKLAGRLLTFFVGIPLVLAVVFFDVCASLPLHVLGCVFSVIGCLELYTIFSKNTPLLPKPLLIALDVLIQAATYLTVLFKLPSVCIDWIFIFSILFMLGWNALSAKTFERANVSMSLSILLLFYACYLVTFVTRMTAFECAKYYIAVFLFMVFICDSAAWLFGMLFGKNNRGVVASSPNKSAAGFAGGFAGVIAAAFLARLLFPSVFPGALWKPPVFGALVAGAAIVGDLVESVFKRSAGVKDSGGIMPGRGGVLDSIDSILFAAPVYYLLLHLFYGVPLGA